MAAEPVLIAGPPVSPVGGSIKRPTERAKDLETNADRPAQWPFSSVFQDGETSVRCRVRNRQKRMGDTRLFLGYIQPSSHRGKRTIPFKSAIAEK